MYQQYPHKPAFDFDETVRFGQSPVLNGIDGDYTNNCK